jgi:hypothetical protein
MSNEQYLIVSYFGIAFLAVGLSFVIWLWLRRSFLAIIQTHPIKAFALTLRNLFFPWLLLPALLGFFSVSFRGCGKSYDGIIAERSYLIAINQEQLAAIFSHLAVALMGWGLVVLAVLIVIKRRQKGFDKKG